MHVSQRKASSPSDVHDVHSCHNGRMLNAQAQKMHINFTQTHAVSPAALCSGNGKPRETVCGTSAEPSRSRFRPAGSQTSNICSSDLCILQQLHCRTRICLELWKLCKLERKQSYTKSCMMICAMHFSPNSFKLLRDQNPACGRSTQPQPSVALLSVAHAAVLPRPLTGH